MEELVMFEDNNSISDDNELTKFPEKLNTKAEDAIQRMTELLQDSLVSLQLQNLRQADITARTAVALFNSIKENCSQDQRLMLETFKNLISLYAPLTRAIVLQVEGRFERAREEVKRGLANATLAIDDLKRHAQQSKPLQDDLQELESIFSIFSILFKGFDNSIEGEIFAYQGNIFHYKELLKKAVCEFRQVEQLPPTLNPILLALFSFCSTFSERLQTRIEVFSSVQQGAHHRIPTGDKIFIIHGHDEAKWRELRDLLEDTLHQKTVVLKEEPGAGETLIKKFEDIADNCCFAFALITPDDFLEKNGKNYFQARPNVLFEIGWFYGRFGRNHVCILKKATTELPSDLAGILTINFQTDVSEGLLQIGNELKRVGIIESSPSLSTR